MTLEIQNVTSRKELQFPMILRQMTEEEAKEYHKNKRIAAIRNFAERRPRPKLDPYADFDDLNIEQQEWVEGQLNESRSWERWHGMIEEWEPWNRYGQPVNIWRYYKK
jgi:hypothetical protein